jgi:methyltransferase (TIGR00027 family)
MSNKISVTDVTDTALWVAALRAKETKRSNAAFQDPLASLLAGERGVQIERSIPNSAVTGWGVVMRTAAIDKLIADALQMGVDTVVNLGAGLDTRPYRLNLQSHIQWFEIDFPILIQLKNAALAGHAPKCHLERIGMDLRDRSARNRFFKTFGPRGKTLLIAEGFVPYLPNEEVANLARDLLAVPSIHYWILDFDNAGIRKTPRSWAKRLEAAPFLFQPGEWFKFFEGCGWRAEKVITSGEESERLRRPYPFTLLRGLLMRLLPGEVKRRVLAASGGVLLRK